MKITSGCKLGFTLIELIITLTIVAILTIAAIPTIKNHINQSKVSDALLEVASLQTEINQKVMKNKTVVGSGTGINQPENLGRYIKSFTISPNGSISIITSNSASGVALTLTPSYSRSSSQVTWSCAVSNASFNSYVPAQCRI